MCAERMLTCVLPIMALAYSSLALGATTSDCLVEPPTGPFEAVMEQSSQAPTAGVLPSNPGAWSTLISPAPQHRWDSKGGLVESLDGSLLLHGVVSGPNTEPGLLNVVVLADYEPVMSAVISVWDSGREQRLSLEAGSRAGLDIESTTAAFDIALPPLTVAEGTYREIQTLVWFDAGSIDARRWTVYAGPTPPDSFECIAANDEVGDMPARSRLESDGQFVVRAPRAATLAVVPLSDNGQDLVKFVRIDQAKRGWEGQFGTGVELAAVWEGPFTGPGKNWISSFWSARQSLQSSTSGETPANP